MTSEPCQAVLDAYAALQAGLNDFAAALRRDQALPAWVSCDDGALLSHALHSDPRERAIAGFSQLYYLDAQAPREILIMAGFLGASAETIAIAHQLNAHKHHFKRCVLALKALKALPIDLSDPDNVSASHRSPMAKRLNQLGLSRLHLKQTYRLVPILEAPPQKLSWTWANTKAIQKITVAEAQRLLHKKGDDPGIHIQLQQLNYCDPREPLAIVQTLAPHLRTNVLFHPNHSVARKMIKGPLPILYPCDFATPIPQFSPPGKKEATQRRAQRSDVKLEPQVFLPAIRAFRYQKEKTES